MNVKDRFMITAYAAIWRTTSNTIAKKLEQLNSKASYDLGVSMFNHLKQELDNLESNLDKFEYQGDPFGGKLNVVFPEWYVCLMKKGDCDDSAFLLSKIINGGQIWAIIKSISNTDAAGHCIYMDPDKYVWSNFKKENQYDSIEDAAKHYISKWKYAIQLTPDIKIKKIVER